MWFDQTKGEMEVRGESFVDINRSSRAVAKRWAAGRAEMVDHAVLGGDVGHDLLISA
jgi:hypothetical protein